VEGSREHSNEPSVSIKCWTILSRYTAGGFSSRDQLHVINYYAVVMQYYAVNSAKLVPTFADTGCHIVSLMDPYGRILGFLDRNVMQLCNTKWNLQ
jgi:CBS-domain-containing membrane protein